MIKYMKVYQNIIKDIEWIFFDVGSTLIDESEVYKHRIKGMVDEAQITYDEVYNRMVEFYKVNKKGDKEVAKELGIKVPKWQGEYEKLYEDTKKCLETLSKKYKIGIIANQSLGTADRLREKGILQYIDLVVASAEEGVKKPDLKIFNIALERAKCSPKNAIMIGDRLDNDIAPAKKIGMKTIWVKQGFGGLSSYQNNDEVPDLAVSNLMEIIKNIL
ncbi:MAG: HAD family hydrolase [Clostridiaceae bacterium]|nr:HAD family hydrolase [Clostridiaceae bacterium]